VSFWGKVGSQSAALATRRGITTTAGVAAVVLVAGGVYAATSHGSGGPGTVSASSVADSKPLTHVKTAAPAKPLKLVSVSPGKSATDVNGTNPITVTFDGALSSSSRMPQLSPGIAGSWHVSGDTATFTPQTGFMPETTVTVTIPSGMTPSSKSLSALKTSDTVKFTTGSYSTLRLQQLLAQLGYLPFTWTPSSSSGSISGSDASAQLAAVYSAPAGSFSLNGDYPSELTGQWVAGENNMLVTGAVRAFEYNQGLTMDGEAGPEVWSHLLDAVAKDQTNTSGYSYALATQSASDDESLQVWHNGKRILDTPANTGIAAAPTADGTYPVYEKLQFQDMQGTNPDGSKYDDPVYWISYFNGGDAIHGFVRASYGWYQSLGCVELPPSTAEAIWPDLPYGTLVTVQGPVA
jgi:peptidoglycan hydrolase-like protein with peptidoglycan-binding domain